MRRYKAQIKQSISEAINKRSVTDIDSGESVSIPTDDINEPMFHQGRGGCVTVYIRETITLYKMTASSGLRAAVAVAGAARASQRRRRRPDGFVFQISKDEYLDLLFEDLALPNLKKNQQRQLTEFKTHRAGFTANGVPANISVVRSCKTRWRDVPR